MIDKKSATQAFARVADLSLNLVRLFQRAVLLVGDRLQPLVAVARLGVGMVGEVLHPAVFGGAVPVLHALGNGDDGARDQRNGFLAPFLIPTATTHANQHLHGTVVNVPVVAAARLEADVAEAACWVEDSEVAVANEILCVCGVGFSNRPRRV